MHDNDPDAAKYAALEQEMAQVDRDEGREPHTPAAPEAEAYDPERQPAQHYEQQHHEPAQIPDQMEDPIAHYDARLQQMEGWNARQREIDTARTLRDFAVQSENAMNDETSGDYMEAIEHLEKAHRAHLASQLPDGPKTDQLAMYQGFSNAAALREAILNRDKEGVVARALQTGQNPAQLYYQHAVQDYGWKPRIGFTRSQTRRLLDAAEEGGKKFDDMWEKFAKAERRADEARRGR
jgi:hypothetical protein